MLNLTAEEERFVRFCLGKFKLKVPDFSGIKVGDKMLAHMKVDGEISLVDVEIRSEVTPREYTTPTGRVKVVDEVSVWNFDTGVVTIKAKELRVVKND